MKTINKLIIKYVNTYKIIMAKMEKMEKLEKEERGVEMDKKEKIMVLYKNNILFINLIKQMRQKEDKWALKKQKKIIYYSFPILKIYHT